MRDDVVCMMRVRNEARWIRRSLERTFQVASTVVVWDDGSVDETHQEAAGVVTQGKIDYPVSHVTLYGGRVDGLYCVLHYLRSPFRPAVNDMESVSEIRDKNILWWYVKAQVPFRHVLCMDGDEVLSRRAVRDFGEAVRALEGGVDMLSIPFVYLWNDERTRRVDAIYGDADGTRGGEAPDGLPRLRFPRLFTTVRCDPFDVFEQRFAWSGHRQGRRVLGGFHCGSVPQENFLPKGTSPARGTANFPVLHFGYMHEADRRAKHAWYNKIDPGNKYEGEYKHIVEEPNIHAPGPSRFAPWEDV